MNTIRIKSSSQDTKRKPGITQPVISAKQRHALKVAGLTAENVFWYLAQRSKIFKRLEMSQSAIAKTLGVTRETVNRTIRLLSELGLINKYFRYKRTCLYIVMFFPFCMLLSQSQFQEKTNDNSVQSEYVTLYYNISYISKSVSVSQSERVTNSARTHAHTRDDLTTRKEKTGVVMNNKPVSLAIQQLGFLHLSKWGQIRLMIFPDEVITAAAFKYQRQRGIKKPWGYFETICKEICREKGLALETERYMELTRKYPFPENPVLIFEQAENDAPFEGSKAPKTGNLYDANKERIDAAYAVVHEQSVAKARKKQQAWRDERGYALDHNADQYPPMQEHTMKDLVDSLQIKRM